jgi:hypothetical protein
MPLRGANIDIVAGIRIRLWWMTIYTQSLTLRSGPRIRRKTVVKPRSWNSGSSVVDDDFRSNSNPAYPSSDSQEDTRDDLYFLQSSHERHFFIPRVLFLNSLFLF